MKILLIFVYISGSGKVVVGNTVLPPPIYQNYYACCCKSRNTLVLYVEQLY